ncbi:CaiB/BaiF CoA-transferase family protein [Solibacillus sp. FSL R5-0691]|uniref:CaiB/BaiF CoA transferase family protein n=1 Tax=Solibacillus sp. FSL R5-0691 TaxID=2921653 RepID=UPI0030CE2E5B
MLLKGLKVLDFSTLLPGPFATMMLADLGAEVVHVTKPVEDGKEWGPDEYLQRSKKSLAVDLKSPEVVASIRELLKEQEYDIVVEQFRPGVMARLGLDYDSLKAINSGLIYCSITGYGQTGPYSERGGHDINYVALAGLQGYSGTKESGPANIGFQVADLAGGSMHAVIGILSAVIYREKTGIGQHLDISMTDCALTLNALFAHDHLAEGKPLAREELILNGGSFYGYYETLDGRYLSVGSLEPKFRQQLCEAIGSPDLLRLAMSSNPADLAMLKEQLGSTFLQKTLEEWQSIFSEVDACVEPVLSFEETVAHPLFKAREMFVEIEKPDGTTQKQIACPIKSNLFKASYGTIGVKAGTHNEDILGSLLKKS